VTNFNEPGMFVYRVSGAHPIDPRFGQKRGRSSAAAQQPQQTLVGEEEYEYTQDQQDYDSVPEDQLGSWQGNYLIDDGLLIFLHYFLIN
jgi:hypothetical protein